MGSAGTVGKPLAGGQGHSSHAVRAELGDRGRTWCPLQGQSHPDPSTGFPSPAGAAGLGVLHPPPNIILDRGGTSLTRRSHPPLPAAFHRAGFGISIWEHPPCPGNILPALEKPSLRFQRSPSHPGIAVPVSHSVPNGSLFVFMHEE